jgi:hypothetical protein
MDGQHVWVRNRRCRTRFALKTPSRPSTVSQVRSKDFDGHRTVEIWIKCFEHNPHPTTTNPLLNQILAQRCPWDGHECRLVLIAIPIEGCVQI